MSSSKENKKRLINKAWHVKYELVYDHFCAVVDSKGFKANVRGFCDFLGISAGKRQKWSQGQWPSAEDLKTLHDKLGFSYRWLVTGEGDPFEEGGTLPEADIAKQTEEARVHGLEHRVSELERENSALRARLEAGAEGDLRARVADLEAALKQLQTRLFIDGVGDKDAARSIGKASEGHE